MAEFVLVHGAWHGGWCWAALANRLRDLGHVAHTPTLTGLGERSHLCTSEITPATHVLDIVHTFKWRDIDDAILVGHSYGGAIITGAAGLIPERIAGLVYLDAVVPEESGTSLYAKANPERMAALRQQIAAGAQGIEPDFAEAWTDDPEKQSWLRAMCTPQPAGTIGVGVTLTGREHEIQNKAFILAERNAPSAFWGEYERLASRPDWEMAKIQTKHDAMIEDPDGLAALLDGYARRWARP